MDWKLKKSQIVFDNFTQIEERTYEMPDGAIKKYYIKLNRPAVCILALTPDDKVVVVEQFRPGPARMLLELPGGFVDEGETSAQAAARELREETGYQGKLEFITDCLDDAYATIHRACYVATDCIKTSEQALDDSEFINVKLLNLPDFLQLVRSGQMTDVEVALLGLDHLKLLT